MVIASQNISITGWDWNMPDEAREPQFKFNAELSASDKVWRIMTGLVIAAATSVGGFAYNNLQGRVVDLGSQVEILKKRDTERMLLMFEVKVGIEAAADASKEPVKSKLRQVSKRIEDSLKQSQAEQLSGSSMFGGAK